MTRWGRESLMKNREKECQDRKDAGMCPCGQCRTCVENLGSDIERLEERVAKLSDTLTNERKATAQLAVRHSARVAELEYLGKSDSATLVEVRAWMGVEPGKPVIRAVMDASRALARAPGVRGTLPQHANRSRNPE